MGGFFFKVESFFGKKGFFRVKKVSWKFHEDDLIWPRYLWNVLCVLCVLTDLIFHAKTIRLAWRRREMKGRSLTTLEWFNAFIHILGITSNCRSTWYTGKRTRTDKQKCSGIFEFKEKEINFALFNPKHCVLNGRAALCKSLIFKGFYLFQKIKENYETNFCSWRIQAAV